MPVIACDTGGAAAVEQLQQPQAAVKPILGPLGLEADQRDRLKRVHRQVWRIEPAQVLGGQIHAPELRDPRRTSRRMFVSCIATPRSSASRCRLGVADRR